MCTVCAWSRSLNWIERSLVTTSGQNFELICLRTAHNYEWGPLVAHNYHSYGLNLWECFHTRADAKLQWRMVTPIFELQSVHIERDREWLPLSLRFSIPEREEEVWLISVFFWHVDCTFISIRKCAVYQRKWLEGHVAPLPKSQFRGQGIHAEISLHDLRDASLEKNRPSFELCNSNYANLSTHGSKYRHSNDP